jgi:hypothetical protein
MAAFISVTEEFQIHFYSIMLLEVVILLIVLASRCASLSIKSSKGKLLQLCDEITRNPALKDDLLAAAQELELQNKIFQPVQHPELLNGKWKTLYSTLDFSSLRTVNSLTYNALPTSVSADNRLHCKAGSVYQYINDVHKYYDNYVQCVIEDSNPECFFCIATLGTFSIDSENSQRFNIAFSETFVNRISDASLVSHGEYNEEYRKHAPDDSFLRDAFNLLPSQQLRKTMTYSGYSDMTYLDENLRLMRGAAGNLYVLMKEAQ